MGKRKGKPGAASQAPEVARLPRLPSGVTVQKRPLLHPPIPSPASSQRSQKVVYISTSTPFLSAVNRVRKLLSQIEKRQTQSALRSDKYSKRAAKDAIQTAAEIEFDENEKERVVIKGTGKAIEKTMSIALFFLDKSEYRVEFRTGSVLAVDDLVIDPQKYAAKVGENHIGTMEGVEVEDEDLPESRLRYTSVLEGYVWLA